MNDDAQLLRRYAEHASESAFAELVARHIDLVYSAALRQLNGDTHLAQDVAQTVFADLARKARSVSRHGVLTGWLYQATRFAAGKAVRTERRRASREKEAVAMQELSSDANWERLRPVLDEAMSSLGAKDRDAVLLRYFERKELRAVGDALGTSEEAARKRVGRALERLRGYLTGRGVTLSAATLATALTGSAVQTAPVTLAGTISAAVVAGAAAAAASSTFNVLNLMSMTKLKAGILSAAVVVGAGTPMVVQQQSLSRLRAENRHLRGQSQELEQLRAENEQLAGLRADADELGRLRRDVAELHRLRAEVARLRAEKANAESLLTENARLRDGLQKVADAQKRETPLIQENEDPVQASERMKHARQLALGLVTFAKENEGRLPLHLSELQKYFPDDRNLIESLGSQFEIACSGKLTDIKDAPNTILVHEKEPRTAPDGRVTKVYAYADGHSEIRCCSTNNFADWEQKRVIKEPTVRRLQSITSRDGNTNRP